jgi:NAD-dependent dihydropyrimidine dehydrogenase PreA subunit
MAYVIGLPCVDVKDRACVDECPVDCIYEGGRMLYIHPDECVDCGACEPVCPVEAIYYEDDLPDALRVYTAENAQFFTDPLPGQSQPLGSPGGAGRLGPLTSDTPTVAALPPQTS